MYAIQPNTTRTAALKDKLQQLEASHGKLVNLYWQLKNGSPEDVTRLVERIRSDEDVFGGQSGGEHLHHHAATPSSQSFPGLQDPMQDVRRTGTPSSGVSTSQAHQSLGRDRQSEDSMPLDPALRAPDPDLASTGPLARLSAARIPEHQVERSQSRCVFTQQEYLPSQNAPMGDGHSEQD